MNVLVTGANGFVGRHLVSALSTQPGLTVTTLNVDITNKAKVFETVEEQKPDAVFHLAAKSNVPYSFAHPDETFSVNLFGTIHLLEALRKHAPQATLINAGTSDSYGGSFRHFQPVDENTPLEPLNPYSASKAAADLLLNQYAATSELKIIRARAFNHIGPGQNDTFVVPSFAKQLLQIKLNKEDPKLFVGDISSQRDFTDVRDVVAAYIFLFQRRDEITSGEIFNICSGTSVQISKILEMLIELAGVEVEIVQDPQRLRKSDIPVVSASNKKIKNLGWQPAHRLEQTLRDVLSDLGLPEK